MTVDPARLQYLLRQHTARTCTQAELQELYSYITISGNEDLHPLLDAGYAAIPRNVVVNDVDWEFMFNKIVANQQAPAPTRRIAGIHRRWWRMAAAAMVGVLLMAGYWLLFNNNKKEAIPVVTEKFKNDVAPGGDKAILTLGDGSTIILDSTGNGNIAQQGNLEIVKSGPGELSYEINKEQQPAANGNRLYNTLATPRGGQYKVTLPDGTKAWLNAASSIRYPTLFNGNKRQVEITGEVYFEVAKDPSRKFIVATNELSTEVLGTHFNVNAYTDEPVIQVTLVEGSVRVNRSNQSVILKPGEAAQLLQMPSSGSSPHLIVRLANTEEAIAWKNGRFQFRSADIKAVMRQLARWYDLEVIYDVKELPATGFNAKILRNTPASNVLNLLEMTGEVRFEVEGRTVSVKR